MKETISTALVKRVKSDKIICGMITVGTIIGAVIYLFRVITTILSGNYEGNDLQGYVYTLTEAVCAAISLVLLCRILGEIAISGKPFTVTNVKRMRIMAVLLLASVPTAAVLTSLAGFLDPTAMSIGFIISFGDMMMLLFGAIISLLSEIFHYGVKLEEEMDQIA